MRPQKRVAAGNRQVVQQKDSAILVKICSTMTKRTGASQGKPPMPAPRLSRRDLLKVMSLIAAVPLSTGMADAWAERASAQGDAWQLTGRDIDVLAAFDQTIMNFMAERSIPAGTFALTWQQQLVQVRGYNLNRPESLVVPNSLFRIASLSKPITATAILQLVERRLLTLQTRVVNLLDIAPPQGQNRDPRWADISILHLLQHSAGFDRGERFDPMFRDERVAQALDIDLPITLDETIRYMAGQPLDFDPGTRYAYSNFGYALLGRVIEAVSGQSYENYVQENVLLPLGIKRMQLGGSLASERLPGEVSYHADSSIARRRINVIKPNAEFDWAYGGFNLENLAAAAGWVASVVDMARFATAFDDIYNSPLLSSDFIQVMFRQPSFGQNDYGSYYGCGWDVRPMGAWFNTWHIGSLAGSFTLMLRRHDGMNWVVFFNQRSDPQNDRSSYYDIDNLLYATAATVTEVPAYDLFADYL